MSGLKVTAGSYQPLEGELLALPQAATESAVQKDTRSLEPIVGELCALLGPHVSQLVRDENGALDLSRIPAKGFFEFRQFLIDQTAVGDGVIFGSPFSDLIAKNEYQDLWQLLYDRVNHRVLSDFHLKYKADQLLYKFKAELIAIDAEAFVRQNFSSQKGRARLADLLGDNSYRYMEVRPDLVRALARVGKESVDPYLADQITEHVNFSDYFNHWVTDEELAGATRAALALLRSADRVYADVEQRQSDSVEEPVKIVSSLVGAEAVSYFAHQAQFEFAKSDPVSQLKGRLARLWLWAADDNNWGRLPGDYEREDVDFARASVLQNVEDAIEKAPYIQSQSDLEIFNERLQDFLRGPINHHSLGPIDLSLWDKAVDITVGSGLDSLVSGMQTPLRAPFDDLLQLSDEIKFSLAMGEKVTGNRIQETGYRGDKKVQQSATQFIDGLAQTKRSLWYAYKQHKAISRMISNAALLFGAGDIADIRKANAQIDLWVSQISQDPTDQTINQVIEEVFGSLGEGGPLYEALVASEMEGIEQTLGLLQTTLIIVATSIATSGIATAAGVAVRTAAGIAERIAMTEREIRAAQAAIIATKTAATAARTTAAAAKTADEANNTNRRMLKAFGYGAYIATAENAIAVTTGEVRGQPDTLASWGKDALATGVAMSMTGALPVSHGGHGNVIGNLAARYTVGGARGLGYLGMDAGVETAEEGIDQYLRQILDGNTAALSAKQWRELALLSATGGFAKVGAVAEAVRGSSKPPRTDWDDDGGTLVRGDTSREVLPLHRSDRSPLGPTGGGATEFEAGDFEFPEGDDGKSTEKKDGLECGRWLIRFAENPGRDRCGEAAAFLQKFLDVPDGHLEKALLTADVVSALSRLPLRSEAPDGMGLCLDEFLSFLLKNPETRPLGVTLLVDANIYGTGQTAALFEAAYEKIQDPLWYPYSKVVTRFAVAPTDEAIVSAGEESSVEDRILIKLGLFDSQNPEQQIKAIRNLGEILGRERVPHELKEKYAVYLLGKIASMDRQVHDSAVGAIGPLRGKLVGALGEKVDLYAGPDFVTGNRINFLLVTGDLKQLRGIIEAHDERSVHALRLLVRYRHDLGGYDLRGLDLRWFDFYGINLAGADLRGADIRGADFTKGLLQSKVYGPAVRYPDKLKNPALLAGVRFEGCKLDKDQVRIFANSDINLAGADLHGLDLDTDTESGLDPSTGSGHGIGQVAEKQGPRGGGTTEFEDGDGIFEEPPGDEPFDEAQGGPVDDVAPPPFDANDHRSEDIDRLTRSWREHGFGSTDEFEKFLSKLDDATLATASFLFNTLRENENTIGEKALLRIMGDPELRMEPAERQNVVKMVHRHYSKFGDPGGFLNEYVRTAIQNNGANGHLFELELADDLEGHSFIEVQGISVKFEGRETDPGKRREIDLSLKAGNHEFFVELKTSLGMNDVPTIAGQMRQLGRRFREKGCAFLVVVKDGKRIVPAAKELVEMRGVPVFSREEFLALSPAQFEELWSRFQQPPKKADVSGAGDKAGDGPDGMGWYVHVPNEWNELLDWPSDEHPAIVAERDKRRALGLKAQEGKGDVPQTRQVALRDRIERAIEASGINHQKFARMVGVSGSYITLIKSGDRIPPVELRQKIENVLLSLEKQPQGTETTSVESAQTVDGAPRDNGLSAHEKFRRSKVAGTALGMVVTGTAAAYEKEARKRGAEPAVIEKGLDAIFGAAVAIHEAGNENRAEQFSEILLTLIHSGQINWETRKGFLNGVAQREVFANPARLADYHLVVLSLGDPMMSSIAWNGYLEDLREKVLTSNTRENLKGHKNDSFDENKNHPVKVFKRDHRISRWLGRGKGSGLDPPSSRWPSGLRRAGPPNNRRTGRAGKTPEEKVGGEGR